MLFHDTYAEARAAFREAASDQGFSLSAYPMDVRGPDGGDLTIDVAVKANGPIRRALVISSGTHGVEGYFGSAVQLGFLASDLPRWTPAPGEAVVMIHAVNPWGMAHSRRVNEDGFDLNRNFRLPGERYTGAPELYGALDPLLNPASPPGGLDLFLPKIGAQLARHGLGALKDAIAGGQYEHPQGLFWGGDGPSQSKRILAEVVPELLGKAERVVHLDLHTGSGPWGTYVLALDDGADSPRAARLKAAFGDCVEGFEAGGVLYQIHGALGPWLQAICPDVLYDAALAEFGTYDVVRVLLAMRFENRVVRFAATNTDLREEAALRMRETFCPSDGTWRRSCVDLALTMCRRGLNDLGQA